MTEFLFPTPCSWPESIAGGPDGNVWFAQYDGNKIGRISPSGSITGGAITEFPIRLGDLSPNFAGAFLTAGPDGNLWLTDYDYDYIGVVTP